MLLEDLHRAACGAAGRAVRRATELRLPRMEGQPHGPEAVQLQRPLHRVRAALHVERRVAQSPPLGGELAQIASFVLPVVVLVGWALHQDPGFTLNFDPFISLILTLSVIHAYFVSADGNSNWLAGVQLVATYVLIALLYLFLHDKENPKAPTC